MKPRLPRIERDEEYNIEDETGSLWAVSYADFLMVLLSFFILFFSTEDTNSVINKILSATNNKDASTYAGGGSPRSPDSVHANLPSNILENIENNYDVKVEKLESNIFFIFPENIYNTGATELNNNYKSYLKDLINKLKPFEKEIEMEFVGHTDSKPLVYSANEVVDDNFTLSVIRAARALQYAQSLGFPAENMAAKGSAEMKRNTRSLSIMVKAKKEGI